MSAWSSPWTRVERADQWAWMAARSAPLIHGNNPGRLRSEISGRRATGWTIMGRVGIERWGIEHRVLLIALLPAVVIAIALTAYHTQNRIAELETRTLAHAESSARQLVTVARLGLATGDHAVLAASLRSRVIDSETVMHGLIRDGSGRIVAEFGREPDDHSADASTHRMIAHSVVPVGLPAARATGSNLERHVGEVELLVDLGPVRSQQMAALAQSLGLSLLVLTVTGIIAIHTGRRVTRPVQDITRAVERIAAGDLSVRLEATSPGAMGRLERGVGIMVDEIRTNQESMENRVREATRELQTTLRELEARNEELDEARRVAEAASEFKSRFLANISHEIRTPMNSVLGFAELLRDADLDPVHADYVETIHQSAYSLLTLLNGILDLSKIESGRMELEPTQVNLNHLLGEIFRLLAPEAFRKGVEFVVVPIPPERAMASADPVRLKQVLLNLASNAVKFTDSGHVLITPTVEPSGDGMLDVRCRIEDTGCGISRECRDHLFEAFAQGESASPGRNAQSGTGLGLHIASELVFLMNGDVEFESEPGSGSVFEVSLRLAGMPEARQATASPLTRPGRIVLVESDPRLREAIAALVDAAGCACEPVDSVHAASRTAGPEDMVVVHVPASIAESGNIAPLPQDLRNAAWKIMAYSHAHEVRTREVLFGAGYSGILHKTADPQGLRQELERLNPAREGDVARAREEGCHINADSSGAQWRALVIDDHPINRKLVESYLRNDCASMRLAESGAEALLLAAREPFDFILVDLHLPDIHGLEVARRIRAAPGPNQHVPMIAVTADTLALQDERVIAAGMNDLLIKPIRREDLRTRIVRNLSIATRHAGAVDAPGPPAPNAMKADARANRESAVSAREREHTGMVEELRAMLLHSLPESRSAIAGAVGAGDAEALRGAVHRLHGAVAYCDEPDLLAIVQESERAARDAVADGSWQQAERAAHRLLAFIDQLLARGGLATSANH